MATGKPTAAASVKPASLTRSAPQLNSMLRIEKRIQHVKSDLRLATENGSKSDIAVELARKRLLNSPRTNSLFRQTASKKVNFAPHEKVFSNLADLSIKDEERLPPVSSGSLFKPGVRDPEPQLQDFHRPYDGEEECVVCDITSLRNLVDECSALSQARQEAPSPSLQFNTILQTPYFTNSY